MSESPIQYLPMWFTLSLPRAAHVCFACADQSLSLRLSLSPSLSLSDAHAHSLILSHTRSRFLGMRVRSYFVLLRAVVSALRDPWVHCRQGHQHEMRLLYSAPLPLHATHLLCFDVLDSTRPHPSLLSSYICEPAPLSRHPTPLFLLRTSLHPPSSLYTPTSSTRRH